MDREQRKVETDAEAPARQAEEAELEAVSVQLRCTITEFLEVRVCLSIYLPLSVSCK